MDFSILVFSHDLSFFAKEPSGIKRPASMVDTELPLRFRWGAIYPWSANWAWRRALVARDRRKIVKWRQLLSSHDTKPDLSLGSGSTMCMVQHTTYYPLNKRQYLVSLRPPSLYMVCLVLSLFPPLVVTLWAFSVAWICQTDLRGSLGPQLPHRKFLGVYIPDLGSSSFLNLKPCWLLCLQGTKIRPDRSTILLLCC